MPVFEVSVTIENRQELSDPEGETILKDLVLKSGGNGTPSHRISRIRTAKMLRMTIDSDDADSAMRDVRAVCDGLQIYNPLVSTIRVELESGGGAPARTTDDSSAGSSGNGTKPGPVAS